MKANHCSYHMSDLLWSECKGNLSCSGGKYIPYTVSITSMQGSIEGNPLHECD